MSTKSERPSSGDTMCLTLRQGHADNYRHLLEFAASENERRAHRKNRVIQMKLGACLAEISLQQKSSAQLFKLEEIRFTQSVKRRSREHRSAKMLEELKSQKGKKLDSASFTLSTFSTQKEHACLRRQRMPASHSCQDLLASPNTRTSFVKENIMEKNVYDSDKFTVNGHGPDVVVQETYSLQVRGNKDMHSTKSGIPSRRQKETADDNSILSFLVSNMTRTSHTATEFKSTLNKPQGSSASSNTFRNRRHATDANISLQKENVSETKFKSDAFIRAEIVKSDIAIVKHEIKTLNKEGEIVKSDITKVNIQGINEDNDNAKITSHGDTETKESSSKSCCEAQVKMGGAERLHGRKAGKQTFRTYHRRENVNLIKNKTWDACVS